MCPSFFCFTYCYLFILQGKESSQAILTKLKCGAGLAELATKKYKQAAKQFLQANLDHCDFPELLSPSNIAIYGGLCALATFDRSELQKYVIFSRRVVVYFQIHEGVGWVEIKQSSD